MSEQTVLITGCSSGIGRATAAAFLDSEWEVYATARNPADIEQLGEAGCHIATLDVTDDEDVERVVDRIIDERGRIDVLVNNAAYGQFGPLEDVPVEELHEQFDVNVYGPHRLARAVLPHMRERGDGTIINVSSLSGRVATPGMGAYCGSKFALEGMSDALRYEVDEHGIDVVCIEPGPVETEFKDTAAEYLDERTADSGAYETLYEIAEQQTAAGVTDALAVSPKRVAEVIVEAGCAPSPHTRYQVGPVARYGDFARIVPDRILNAAYRVVAKLAR